MRSRLFFRRADSIGDVFDGTAFKRLFTCFAAEIVDAAAVFQDGVFFFSANFLFAHWIDVEHFIFV
jgi:hypothetical protein